MKLLTIIATTLLLTGCMAPKNVKTYVEADAGNAPINYETTIKARLQETLKDPDSIKAFSVEKPILGSCSGYWKTQKFIGWHIKTTYNAKNSLGAYVGTKDHYYWFHNEELKAVSESATYCPDHSLWVK